jgi:hypothetical protein
MKPFLIYALLLGISMLQNDSSVKRFSWLIGNWKIDKEDAYEKWEVVNDTTLGGIGYHFIVEEHDKDETDIIFDESIRLVSRGDKFYYIPAPRNQNAGKEVEFEIVSFTKNSFVAENRNHDFPKRIVYQLEDNTHLHAYIEGNKKRIDFRFTKKNP